jgi:hypothetical protein
LNQSDEADLAKKRQMMQIRLNDHEEGLAKSLRLVHHLAGLYPFIGDFAF